MSHLSVFTLTKRPALSAKIIARTLAAIIVSIGLLFAAFVNASTAISEGGAQTLTQAGEPAFNATRLHSAKLSGNVLNLEVDGASVSISALGEQSVEVFYQPDGLKQLPSFALADGIRSGSDVQASLSRQGDDYVFSLKSLDVFIQANPFKLRFKKGDTVLTEEEAGLFVFDTVRGFRFALDDTEQILGGGQRVLGMDRRGHRLPLYNKAHYGYSTQSNQMYYSLPAIMSSKNYIIAFDNSANGFLDIGHTENKVLQFEADAGRTSYIFTSGENPADLVRNFVQVTGKQPMVPRWALGNYASRFGYKTQQQTLDTINAFIDQDFPVDAVVLDLYWFGPDIKGHMGNLNWHKPSFPEPEKMIAELKEKGVKTIMITEPFILSTSSQWQSAVDNKALAKNLAGKPRRFDFYFGNTGLVDVFDTNAQDWFWQYYQALNEQGVAGWWGDLGEPEVHPGDSLHHFDGDWVTGDEIHNVYGHKWAQMVFERQQRARPNERPFIMMRSGFLGSQRYGMIPWTGDVERSWNGLKPQVELSLQMSLFGLAYTHSDLGGFAGGESFDAELYTRWMQYGVFQPVYRPHAQDNIAPEPVFHDQTTQDLVRPFVKLRYQLLPYNYSLSMENSLSGLPMMRPLFLSFPDADISRTDAYMWGDALLVSPVVSKDVREQSIALPKGVWFNFFGSHEQSRPRSYTGGKTVTVPAPIDELPVLVKAGAFVPMVDAMQNTQNYSTERLHVRHYTDASVRQSKYTMYEDDGENPESLSKGEYQRIEFSSERSDDLLSLKMTVNGAYTGAPDARRVMFKIYGLDVKPSTVNVNALDHEFTQKAKATDKNTDINALLINDSDGVDEAMLAKRDGAVWDQASQTLLISSEVNSSLSVDIGL
ncbi:TIM-barrel domain-containing protein [Glaciecola siphonariae]|uniref:TIM-barrel domain-containing protein n=1 Tax=Glaciecola siphonariae TaxID=521012 RepID=A0ABV9LRM5_9ALTE